MMDEDRIKSEGGIEAPSVEHINQDYFEMEIAETEFIRNMKKEIDDRGLSWEYNPQRTEIGIFEGEGNKKVGWMSIAKDSAFFYEDRHRIEECCTTPFARVWFNEHGYLPTKFVQAPILDKEEVMNDAKVSESYIPQTSNKSDIMKEFEDVTNTDNYHGAKGEYEPIKVMEYIMLEYAKRNIPPEKAMMVAIAIKYLLRAGTKDDFNKEMFKAINFITRARYAKWLPCDFNKKMGGE